jgi:CO dehydrogenase maturation factor
MKGHRPWTLAVLGKGGAGKTVFSALAARVLLDRGLSPLLLVDADPTGGLAWALGAGMGKTLGDVRAGLIRGAGQDGMSRGELASRVDWMALEALQEHGPWSLLAMGRTDTAGCFCPVNSLLRDAVTSLAGGHRAVILDAEAGLEQINRQVIRRVDACVVISDGSARGLHAARRIHEALTRTDQAREIGLVLNQAPDTPDPGIPALSLMGRVPRDPALAALDQAGRSLLELSDDSPALDEVRAILTHIRARAAF